MTAATCEKESRILTAVRSGLWTAELRAHVLECPICSDVALVGDFLLIDAAQTRARVDLPDSSLVWRKVQLVLESRAFELATRPVRVVQVLAYLTSAITLIWLILAINHAQSWLIEFWYRMQRALGDPGPTVMVGMVGCLLCTLVGCVYVAWSER